MPRSFEVSLGSRTACPPRNGWQRWLEKIALVPMVTGGPAVPPPSM